LSGQSGFSRPKPTSGQRSGAGTNWATAAWISHVRHKNSRIHASLIQKNPANPAGIYYTQGNPMKPRRSSRRNHALTLVEVLVVIFVVVLLAAVLLPALAAAKKKSSKINCVNNLKQIGLSCRIWAGDNNDHYPAEVSVSFGGAMELALNGNAVAIFQVMSNELSTPKVLVCPCDTNSPYATDFSVGLSANNISYFFSLDASSNCPTVLLSGDDNFALNGATVKSGLLILSPDSSIGWTRERHDRRGNIVMADGSVQQLSNSGLTDWLHRAEPFTNRLALP
jgi:prepilin-type processing-associated H-X9-DG protein